MCNTQLLDLSLSLLLAYVSATIDDNTTSEITIVNNRKNSYETTQIYQSTTISLTISPSRIVRNDPTLLSNTFTPTNAIVTISDSTSTNLSLFAVILTITLILMILIFVLCRISHNPLMLKLTDFQSTNCHQSNNSQLSVKHIKAADKSATVDLEQSSSNANQGVSNIKMQIQNICSFDPPNTEVLAGIMMPSNITDVQSIDVDDIECDNNHTIICEQKETHTDINTGEINMPNAVSIDVDRIGIVFKHDNDKQSKIKNKSKDKDKMCRINSRPEGQNSSRYNDTLNEGDEAMCNAK